MPIVVNLDVMLARRKMTLTELSEKVGTTIVNLSILKTGRAKAIRFSTLDSICIVLQCQPGDILEYMNVKDYELLMRFIYKNKISHCYIPSVLVYMRTGGVSNKNILSRYTLNKEIIRACKENGVNTNMAVLSFKYLNKIFEYIRPMVKAPGK